MNQTPATTQVAGMQIEKASIADFVLKPEKNYFVLVNYKFMRLLGVEVGVKDTLSPTVELAEYEVQYGKPDERPPRIERHVMPNIEQCLFRLTPNA